MDQGDDTLREVIDSLTQSEEWHNVRLLLGRLDTKEARAAIDTMDLLNEHFERICKEKPIYR